jgi:hypothetical protein
MDVAIINELTRKLEERVSKIGEDSDSVNRSHFKHITKNSLMPLSGLAEMYENGEITWVKMKDNYCTSASVLANYLDLLERFTDFKEKELNTVKGYFPEKFDDPNLVYVTYAWEQLNHK